LLLSTQINFPLACRFLTIGHFVCVPTTEIAHRCQAKSMATYKKGGLHKYQMFAFGRFGRNLV